MLKLILPEGRIVSIKDKYGNEETYDCDGKHEFQKPLAVLVNGYSASASEIFAGAVKDYGIGTLVGTTTYGKGIVQELFSFEDDTMIKITTAEYFTPSGENIHKKRNSAGCGGRIYLRCGESDQRQSAAEGAGCCKK